jgi:hypothetical protein
MGSAEPLPQVVSSRFDYAYMSRPLCAKGLPPWARRVAALPSLMSFCQHTPLHGVLSLLRGFALVQV